MEEKIKNNKIIILELPEGDKAGTCSLNKDDQDELIFNFKRACSRFFSGEDVVLTLPPNAKVKIIESVK